MFRTPGITEQLFFPQFVSLHLNTIIIQKFLTDNPPPTIYPLPFIIANHFHHHIPYPGDASFGDDDHKSAYMQTSLSSFCTVYDSVSSVHFFGSPLSPFFRTQSRSGLAFRTVIWSTTVWSGWVAFQFFSCHFATEYLGHREHGVGKTRRRPE